MFCLHLLCRAPSLKLSITLVNFTIIGITILRGSIGGATIMRYSQMVHEDVNERYMTSKCVLLTFVVNKIYLSRNTPFETRENLKNRFGYNVKVHFSLMHRRLFYLFVYITWLFLGMWQNTTLSYRSKSPQFRRTILSRLGDSGRMLNKNSCICAGIMLISFNSRHVFAGHKYRMRYFSIS